MARTVREADEDKIRSWEGEEYITILLVRSFLSCISFLTSPCRRPVFPAILTTHGNLFCLAM